MEQEENKKKKWLRIGSNLLFYGLLAALIFSSDAKAFVLQQLVRVGLFNAEIKTESVARSNAGAFSFYTADGKVVSTDALKGKVVFINFWATWCPPCQAEMPSLQALHQKFQNDDRIVFLFISEDEDLGKATQYLQSLQTTFPLLTRAGEVPEALFSGTLPTTVVLDKKGNLVYKKEGIANYNSSAFITGLKNLL